MSPAQLIADLVALNGPRMIRLCGMETGTEMSLLADPGRFTEDEPTESCVQGWVLVDGTRRVFATAQDVPTSHLIKQLGYIAAQAGLPEFMAHAEVYTGREGSALLHTLRCAREMMCLDGPTSAHVGVIGMPTLMLHTLAPP